MAYKTKKRGLKKRNLKRRSVKRKIRGGTPQILTTLEEIKEKAKEGLMIQSVDTPDLYLTRRSCKIYRRDKDCYHLEPLKEINISLTSATISRDYPSFTETISEQIFYIVDSWTTATKINLKNKFDTSNSGFYLTKKENTDNIFVCDYTSSYNEVESKYKLSIDVYVIYDSDIIQKIKNKDFTIFDRVNQERIHGAPTKSATPSATKSETKSETKSATPSATKQYGMLGKVGRFFGYDPIEKQKKLIELMEENKKIQEAAAARKKKLQRLLEEGDNLKNMEYIQGKKHDMVIKDIPGHHTLLNANESQAKYGY